MKEKILIVDDEELNLKLLTQWLIPLGYEVEFALNGEEAVQKTRTHRPDLVIKNIFNTVREAILIPDENMRVLSANVPHVTIIPCVMSSR